MLPDKLVPLITSWSRRLRSSPCGPILWRILRLRTSRFAPIMLPYLEAHDAFVEWLQQHCDATAAEVERAILALAKCAAHRGMSDAHWTFVVDGLIAHAKRRCPQNAELPALIERGFELSANWPTIKNQAASG